MFQLENSFSLLQIRISFDQIFSACLVAELHFLTVD